MYSSSMATARDRHYYTRFVAGITCIVGTIPCGCPDPRDCHAHLQHGEELAYNASRNYLVILIERKTPVTVSSSTRRIRVGVQMQPQHTTYPSYVEAVRRFESMGVDTLWDRDHFFPLYGDPQGNHYEG
jgi:hypothetical protein